jgi:hypothetical protein
MHQNGPRPFRLARASAAAVRSQHLSSMIPWPCNSSVSCLWPCISTLTTGKPWRCLSMRLQFHHVSFESIFLLLATRTAYYMIQQIPFQVGMSKVEFRKMLKSSLSGVSPGAKSFFSTSWAIDKPSYINFFFLFSFDPVGS